jgi:hypothetical protein
VFKIADTVLKEDNSLDGELAGNGGFILGAEGKGQKQRCGNQEGREGSKQSVAPILGSGLKVTVASTADTAAGLQQKGERKKGTGSAAHGRGVRAVDE